MKKRWFHLENSCFYCKDLQSSDLRELVNRQFGWVAIGKWECQGSRIKWSKVVITRQQYLSMGEWLASSTWYLTGCVVQRVHIYKVTHFYHCYRCIYLKGCTFLTTVVAVYTYKVAHSLPRLWLYIFIRLHILYRCYGCLVINCVAHFCTACYIIMRS